MRAREEGGQRFLYQDGETIELNFGRLAEAQAVDPTDPRFVMLNRFAMLIYLERTGQPPEPHDNIRLRHADDLAVAAMFGVDYPNVTEQTMALVQELGVTPSPHPSGTTES
jgi:hypothetical protein